MEGYAPTSVNARSLESPVSETRLQPPSVLGPMRALGEPGPPRIVAGRGARVTLEDGRELIDAKHMAPVLGHRHPELVAAIRQAADRP